jgi:hypothetical protein
MKIDYNVRRRAINIFDNGFNMCNKASANSRNYIYRNLELKVSEQIWDQSWLHVLNQARDNLNEH